MAGLERSILTGWLNKFPRQRFKFSAAKSEKKRYFYLSSKEFAWYDDDCVANPGAEQKGLVSSDDILAVEQVKGTICSNGFQVVHRENNKTTKQRRLILYIRCCSFDEQMLWITELREVLRQCCSVPDSKFHPEMWTGLQFPCCRQYSRSAPGCELTFMELSRQGGPSQDGNRKQDNFDGEWVFAIQDRSATKPDELSLIKGDRYLLLSSTAPHWWLARNAKGNEGLIPSNCVKRFAVVDAEEWYWKGAPKEKCHEELLKQNVGGMYLVRDSVTCPGFYTLSVCHRARGGPLHVVEYLINVGEAGNQKQFYIKSTHSFKSIAMLINFYRTNSSGIVCRLKEFLPNDKIASRPAIDHERYKIDAANIQRGKYLGEGNFGTVYAGMYQRRGNSIHVALKELHEEKPISDFQKEAETMMKLRHSNLVQIYGICCLDDTFVIVMEFIKDGSLLRKLQSHYRHYVSLPFRMIETCRQVCEGMCYLAEQNCIHRDLAARNVLVCPDYDVKVADFGLSRFIEDDVYISQSHELPLKWTAPEALRSLKFSSKSDVWSFGVLMYEVFSGKEPFEELEHAQAAERVMKGAIPCKPEHASSEFYDNIMCNCFQMDPEDRPTFHELKEVLQLSLNSPLY